MQPTDASLAVILADRAAAFMHSWSSVSGVRLWLDWPVAPVALGILFARNKPIRPMWFAIAIACIVLLALGAADTPRFAAIRAFDQCFQTILGYLLIRAMIGETVDLSRPKCLASFLFICLLPVPLSAAVIASAMRSTGSDASLSEVARHAYLASAVGLVTITPLFLALRTWRRSEWSRPRLAEGGVILAASGGATLAIFLQQPDPLLFLVFPMLCLAALRIGPSGAAVTLMLVAGISSILTLAGHGPIASHFPAMGVRIDFLELYVGCCVLATLPMASILSDRMTLLGSLQESERRFRRLAETAPIGIFLTDREGRITFTNPRWCAIVASAPGHWLGREWTMIVAPEMQASTRAGWQKLLGNHSTFETDLALVDGRGMQRWARIGISSKRDGDDAIVGWIGTLLDIDDRHVAEEKLIHSERAHRLLAEHSTDIIVRMNPMGKMHYISPASWRILGFAPDALSGSRLHDRTHPDDRADIDAAFASIVEGRDASFVFRHERSGGGFVWLEAACSVAPGVEAGEAVEIVGSLRDVGRRREAELAAEVAIPRLVESHRLLTMAGRVAEIGHWRYDIATSAITWSEETYRIHGRKEGTALHLSDGIGCYHPDDIPMVDATVKQALATGASYNFRARIVRPNGEIRHVHSLGQGEIGSDQQILGLFGVIKDITQQVDTEAALVAAKDRAEAAAEAKGAFLATMSHEIRTPMTGILGMLELLGDSGHTPDYRRTVAGIRQSARTLMTVLDDVLDHSKIEQGKLLLEAIDFDLADIARDTVELYRSNAAICEIRVVFEDCGDLPVSGDPARTQQILANFISNAVKFTHQGEVRVACRNVEDTLYRIEVRDTGIGIDDHKLETIFQAFEQADQSTTRRFGGTGLGLSISRRLAEAMGGEVGVTSQLGEGSCFWAELRFDPPTGLPVPGVADACNSDHWARHRWTGIAPPRILVVDDTESTRFVAEAHLAAIGWAVTCACDGLSALGLLATRAFDLVLMDSAMPGLDGISTIRLLRQLPGNAATLPVIGFTAFSQPEQHHMMIDAGAQMVLPKPFTRDVLCRAVQDHLDPVLSRAEPDQGTPMDALHAIPVRFRKALLAVIQSDIARLTGDFDAAMVDGRANEACDALHALKGVADSFCCAQLAQACRFGEAMLQQFTPLDAPWLRSVIAGPAAEALTVLQMVTMDDGGAIEARNAAA